MRRNLPQRDPTCSSRFGPADRRKEGALNKKRIGGACLTRSYPLQERAKRREAWDFCGKRPELLACK